MTWQDECVAVAVEVLRSRGVEAPAVIPTQRLRDAVEMRLAPAAHASDVWVALVPSDIDRCGTTSTQRIVIDTDGVCTVQGVYADRRGKQSAEAVATMEAHRAACAVRIAEVEAAG